MTGRIFEFEDIMKKITEEQKEHQDNLEWFKKRVERATAL